jgi:tRNA G37 N-methylase Trm5
VFCFAAVGKNIENGRNKKGRNFTASVAKEKINLEVKAWEHFDHVVMNLPASALEFLGKRLC